MENGSYTNLYQFPKKSSTGRNDTIQDASISTMRTLGGGAAAFDKGHQGTISSNDYTPAGGTAPRNGKL